MGFLEKLAARRQATGALLCVGLDPDTAKLPASCASSTQPLYEFCRRIVQATAPYACAFKPNLAFFEAFGSAGIAQLERLLAEIPAEIPTVLDGKRGDIGNTSRLYARFLFEHLRGDAATVNPYLGRDALEPFFEFPGCVPIVLCLTSNPGSVDIQTVTSTETNERIYHRVIHLLDRMPGPYGLVVGARHASLIADVRAQAPHAPLLIPGIGAQGGDLAATLSAAAADGAPALVNVSRDILYASAGDDFAEAAAAKSAWYAAEMKRLIAP
ncbi:MAG TPA: orotidine-5'-phosphate decarboxylase [bacterium]|nr:orotidine-5'-phosphate decarboxylase [bacterium]